MFSEVVKACSHEQLHHQQKHLHAQQAAAVLPVTAVLPVSWGGVQLCGSV
jgi:hypothetical protein